MKRITEYIVNKCFEKLNRIRLDSNGLYNRNSKVLYDYSKISYILFTPPIVEISKSSEYFRDNFRNDLKNEMGKMMFLNDYKYSSNVKITQHYL
jgi:hypothetical protein